MKAFKKWVEHQDFYSHSGENAGAKQAWREALKEVQKQINEFNTNFVGDIENWIDEELEN